MQSVRQHGAAIRAHLIAYVLRGVLILFGIVSVATYILSLYIVHTGSDPHGSNLFQIVMVPLITLITFLMGWRINKKLPGHTIALLFLIMSYSLLMAPITLVVLWLNETLPGRFYTQIDAAVKTVSEISWIPLVFIPVFFMPLFFPTGKLLSRRWRIPVIIFLVFMLWNVISIIFRPWPWPENDMVLTRAPNVNGIAGSEAFFDKVQSILELIAGPVFLSIPLSMFLRYRRAGPIERTQMKWPMTVIALYLASISLSMVFPGWSSFDAENGYPIIWTMAMLFPISIGIAILRYRLFDIDILINRTLVYGILTALIIVLYVAIVSGLGGFFQTQISALNGLIATGIIAVIFQPLRERLQRLVNRVLYGERDDPGVVLSRLAHHLQTAETPTAILPNLVQTIAHLLKIPHVAIWLPVAADQMEPVAVWGEACDQMQTIPLTYQQESIGHLVVAPRGPREQFNRHEQDLLATIAALTATTVRAVQLSDELRRSRQRIIGAREEERRRLRRDLHDGLGPQLASQTLGLEAVAQLMPSNPEKAQTLLTSLKTQAHEAIQDVRRLVYDLRPPALDDLGLIGALRQSASHYENGALRFSFDVPETLPELPAAVETAVYRIAQEAMTNVVRHSEATLCTVRLSCANAHVMVEVRDNGRGLAGNHQSGVGLQAMRERTTELNGQYTIESLPEGGTRVEARLPLEVYRE